LLRILTSEAIQLVIFSVKEAKETSIPFSLNLTFEELIYTCKMIQPGIVSSFSQPVYFSRFIPDNLLLSTARFPGYNLKNVQVD
jgi:hypothetical protein